MICRCKGSDDPFLFDNPADRRHGARGFSLEAGGRPLDHRTFSSFAAIDLGRRSRQADHQGAGWFFSEKQVALPLFRQAAGITGFVAGIEILESFRHPTGSTTRRNSRHDPSGS